MNAAPARDERHLSDSAAQIDSLDGVRGVAVLMVLVSHLSIHRLSPSEDYWSLGKAGVYLFFVLSAFLLTTGFLRAGVANLGWRELALYGLRRVLRVYPLFTLVLAITCLHLEGIRHGHSPWVDWSKFWANFTLQRGDGVFWTIAVEVKYYLLIPVIAFMHLVLFRSRQILSVAALVVAIAMSALVWQMPMSAPVETVNVAPYLPIFLAGSLAAILFSRYRAADSPGRLRSTGPATALAWLSIGVVVLCSTMPPAFFGAPQETIGRWIALWAGLWGVLVLCLLVGDPLPRRLFEAPLLRRIGQLCLGIYLFHLPIMLIARLYGRTVGITNVYLQQSLAIVLCLALAELSLRFVERPLSHTSRVERWARKQRSFGGANKHGGAPVLVAVPTENEPTR